MCLLCGKDVTAVGTKEMPEICRRRLDCAISVNPSECAFPFGTDAAGMLRFIRSAGHRSALNFSSSALSDFGEAMAKPTLIRRAMP